MKTTKGFTLVELILYVAIFSVVISSFIIMGWDIIFARTKAGVNHEVTRNIRQLSDRIEYELRSASAVSALSGSSITLVSSDSARNPTVIDLASGRLRIGFGSGGSCPTTSPCNLSSNLVTVNNLQFANLSSGSASLNIWYALTLSSTSTSGSRVYQKTQTYQNTVELLKR